MNYLNCGNINCLDCEYNERCRTINKILRVLFGDCPQGRKKAVRGKEKGQVALPVG